MSDDTPRPRPDSPEEPPPTERMEMPPTDDWKNRAPRGTDSAAGQDTSDRSDPSDPSDLSDRDGLDELFGSDGSAGADDATAVFPAGRPLDEPPVTQADPFPWLGDGAAAGGVGAASLGAAAPGQGAAPDAVTQRYDGLGLGPPGGAFVPPSEPDLDPAESGGDGPSKRVIVILAIVGGVLLLSIAALVIVLMTTGTPTASPSATSSPSATPSATPTATPSPTSSATPSATPSPSPTPTPSASAAPSAPPATPPSVTFTIPDAPLCTAGVDAGEVDYSWQSNNATSVVLTTAGSDGVVYEEELGPSGTSTAPFDCTLPAQEYTITAVGPGGQAAQTVTATQGGIGE